MTCKTRTARLARATRTVHDWCRRHRHLSVKEQHAALSKRLRGHYNYFGVNGNFQSLRVVDLHARRSWYKWLCRRSQKKRLNWARFQDLLRTSPSRPLGSECSSGGIGSASRASGGAGW